MHPLGSNPAGTRQQALLRRATWYTAVFSILGVLAVVGTSVRLPVIVLEPGPAPDVAERTQIAAPTFPSEGSIHLATAQVVDPKGATGKETLVAIFNPDQIVYPRESIYPSDRTPETTESIQVAQMTQSEQEAAVAALSELGMPYQADGVFVTEVTQGSTVQRRLVAGDIITAIDSRPVRKLDDLTSELDRRRPGDSVRLDVSRRSRKLTLSAKLVEPPSKDSSALGAELAQYNKSPIDVSISSRDIGGPSAGLMYALSIYDRLVEDDLTGGRTIAGTGTINNDGKAPGEVGAVGSVKLKVKGADRIGAGVFLVPKKEVAEAREAAGPGMEVIGVSTLKEAIAELQKLPATQVAQKKA